MQLLSRSIEFFRCYVNWCFSNFDLWGRITKRAIIGETDSPAEGSKQTCLNNTFNSFMIALIALVHSKSTYSEEPTE